MDSVLVAPDSLTGLQLHLEALILHLNPPPPPKNKLAYDSLKNEFDQWDTLRSNFHELFGSLRSLQRVFKHVIVIAHEMSVMDEETKEISAVLPNIRGSMRNDYGQYFNEVYNLQKPKLTQKGSVYRVLTKSVGLEDARTSRDLQTIEEADFAILFKDERSQQKESSQ